MGMWQLFVYQFFGVKFWTYIDLKIDCFGGLLNQSLGNFAVCELENNHVERQRIEASMGHGVSSSQSLVIPWG